MGKLDNITTMEYDIIKTVDDNGVETVKLIKKPAKKVSPDDKKSDKK